MYLYLEHAQERMLELWTLPEDGMANREVVVKLVFGPEGSLRDLRIVSATDRRLSRSVAAAVLSGEPYGPVPDEAACLVGLPVRTTFRNPAD